jgi:hypothetical protein
MPMWRCPHCGTPQTETARCWVCYRSSTACATCRHFRRSVAAQLGYCGLDRRRRPLAGDEIRPCWEGWALEANLRSDPPSPRAPALGDATGTATATTARRDFIDVEPGAGVVPTPDGTPAPWPGPAVEAGEPRWNLWGDLDG